MISKSVKAKRRRRARELAQQPTTKWAIGSAEQAEGRRWRTPVNRNGVSFELYPHQVAILKEMEKQLATTYTFLDWPTRYGKATSMSLVKPKGDS